jgi:UDP-N-acetylmuramoyl-L-alanyl-D-glutamate--2,6-diaminopimelate ligase
MSSLPSFTPSITQRLWQAALSAYHYIWAIAGIIAYGYPARHLKVIGITGTKGKTSTGEMLAAIFRHAGYGVAITNTVHFALFAPHNGKTLNDTPNLFRMSMPGRMFLQRFLRRAVRAHIDVAIIEITSEGARQHRHLGLAMDGLIFTNLSPEHIESHGSLAAYQAAKVSIGRAASHSPKKERVLIANANDPLTPQFAAFPFTKKRLFDARPTEINSTLSPTGSQFAWRDVVVSSSLLGQFNIENMVAAAHMAEAFGITPVTIAQALERFHGIPGRVQPILPAVGARAPFSVFVDYAHTADSLEKLYQAFPSARKIAVMGATGGGRDTWKRPVMAQMAEKYCDAIFLTNEDPYDEDPQKIIDDLYNGLSEAGRTKTKIIIDRREAIRAGLAAAQAGNVVLITGKGTDPCICGPKGSKIPWSDAKVAQEELEAALARA